MSIQIHKISDEQVDRVLSLGEGHFYDLKSKDIKPRKLTRSLSAFANADGGEVYIGISEVKNGEITAYRLWNGFVNEEDANGHLQVFAELFPLGTHFKYEFLSSSDNQGLVLHITINKTSFITYASDRFLMFAGAHKTCRLTRPKGSEDLSMIKGLPLLRDKP